MKKSFFIIIALFFVVVLSNATADWDSGAELAYNTIVDAIGKNNAGAVAKIGYEGEDKWLKKYNVNQKADSLFIKIDRNSIILEGKEVDGGKMLQIGDWSVEIWNKVNESDIDAIHKTLLKQYDKIATLSSGIVEFDFFVRLPDGSKKRVIVNSTESAEKQYQLLIGNILDLAIIDGFSLHSGVKFGMTTDEVRKIEKENGFSPSKAEAPFLYYDANGTYMIANYNCLSIMGSMAGYPSSFLTYYFDANDKLVAAIYNFSEHDKKAYNEIQSQIITKYSSMNKKYKTATNIDYFLNELPDGKVPEYDKIHVLCNKDYIITITHALIYDEVSGYNEAACLEFGGKHYLEYRFSTVEELEKTNAAIDKKKEKEKEEKQKKEEERERQKQNDI